MRRFSNIIVGLIAAGVCVLITWLTLDSKLSNIIFNLCFLAVMLIIMIGALAIGFYRFELTRNGLDRASKKLKSIVESGGTISSVTVEGSKLFEVPYLDGKYQEYLRYLHKTNSPTDIGDYIGEYEINNYTHRRLVEMVPDILTSLGILGTFVGLVIGLRGFNPTSYEAMSSSVESLIDGIKVAFATSIYGLSLSLAYSYWLRGTLTSVSESLDKFLDTYYTCAVPPTDATAMNHVIANQNSQTRLMQQMQKDLAKEVAHSLSNQVAPMIRHLDDTMDQFADVVTANQEKLLENIAERIARTMKQEFFSEFLEMRRVMGETNKTQRDHLEFIRTAEEKFQTDVLSGQDRMSQAMDASSDVVIRALGAMNEQEQNLRHFVSDMQQAMNDIVETNNLNLQMSQQMENLSEMNAQIADKMAELSELSGQYTKSLAAVQANNSDLSEGLSVMNDANIRMTDRIAKMNDMTVEALDQSRAAQTEYIKQADEYLTKIQQSHDDLTSQMKTQQGNLREFTDYMTKVLERMNRLSEATDLTLKELSDRVVTIDADPKDIEKSEDTNRKLEKIAALLEQQIALTKEKETQESTKRRGLFGGKR